MMRLASVFQRTIPPAVLMVLLAMPAIGWAAIVRGQIAGINPKQATIDVVGADGKSTTIRVTTATKIVVDKQAANALGLKTGQQAVVVTDSEGKAIRITVTGAAAKPADEPKATGNGGAGGDAGREVSLEKFKLKFQIPPGWKLVKSEAGEVSAECVLQQTQGDKVTATIALWAGEPFIVDASGGDNTQEGTDLAASAKACFMARNWAIGKPKNVPPQRILGGVPKKPVTYGGTQFWSFTFEDDGVTAYGLSTSRREGGALSAGCAAAPEALAGAKRTLAAILGEAKAE